MDLPPAVQRIVEGGIDPYSQHLADWYSQVFLTLLVASSFLLSFVTQSVLVGLEVFVVGFAVMLAAIVPPWPYLNRYRIAFLPVRGKAKD